MELFARVYYNGDGLITLLKVHQSEGDYYDLDKVKRQIVLEREIVNTDSVCEFLLEFVQLSYETEPGVWDVVENNKILEEAFTKASNADADADLGILFHVKILIEEMSRQFNERRQAIQALQQQLQED